MGREKSTSRREFPATESSTNLPARPHLFPALLQKTNVLFLVGVLPLRLIISWLLRVKKPWQPWGRMASCAAVGNRRRPGADDKLPAVLTRRQCSGACPIRASNVEP